MRPSARIALFLLSLATLLGTATPAHAHEGHGEHGAMTGKVALAELAQKVRTEEPTGSDPAPTSGRIDAAFIAAWHEGHGHHRWSGGRGDWGHTWATYRVQARQLRDYLRAVHRASQQPRNSSAGHDSLVWHWAGVANCESSGNWSINTGNGYYGGLQFSLGTWRAYGGEGMPHQQPAWYQAQIADNVRTRSGLHHWPVCGHYYR